MIPNLRVLLAAAMALAAVGALSASAAQAHTTGTFACATTPCAATIETDGASTTATAHHMLVVKNGLGETVSFTAGQLTGYATSVTSPVDTVTFTNLVYHHVTANGQNAIVHMNGCKFDIQTAPGNAPLHDAGSVTIAGCNAGKHIEITITETGCVITVPEQGPLAGLTFHTVAGTSDVTATAKVPGLKVTLDEIGPPGSCLIKNVAPITSEYMTGNVTVQAYNDPGVADQHGGTKVNSSFKPTVT